MILEILLIVPRESAVEQAITKATQQLTLAGGYAHFGDSWSGLEISRHRRALNFRQPPPQRLIAIDSDKKRNLTRAEQEAWKRVQSSVVLRKMHSIRHIFRRLFEFWVGLQVELNGHYSITRMCLLQNYKAFTPTLRVIFATVLSPLPCLLLVTLIDSAPVAPPEAGSSSNCIFWGRNYLSITLMTLAILEQLQLSVPKLHMAVTQVVAVSMISSACAVTFMIVMAATVGFPLPFTLVVGIPIWFVALVVCFGCFFSSAIRQDPTLRYELSRYILVISCQVVLTFIYPAYLYGFRSVDSTTQTFYVLLLPIIKIITKNWISFFMGKKDDLKPQVVILNVEVFNALYVASSMQNSTSISTTMALFLVDFVLAWISINDVNNLLGDITVLLKRIPADHPLKSADFVDIALQIVKEDPRVQMHASLRFFTFASSMREHKPSQLQSIREESDSSIQASFTQRNQIMPSLPEDSKPATFETMKVLTPAMKGSKLLSKAFSTEERLQFVRKTAEVLFTTEFVILIEYTEVIIPFIYCMYVTAMFYLPNKEYYPQIRELDAEALESTIGNVVIYMAMELFSFLAMSVLLKRKLGISTLNQLAFVLDREWRMVQSNLFLWICYTIQNSLDHNGADFSWNFAWLSSDSASSSANTT